ncbi:hypothetical protein DID73_00545 [Candidatus Marinamargulisbacteria bacterium SCGC AG-343-K17]|nr:hypothetical protein DID73_00545 [Candidatus Marinamargulisbacteria bacterium SCGC AG-343-K17]
MKKSTIFIMIKKVIVYCLLGLAGTAANAAVNTQEHSLMNAGTKIPEFQSRDLLAVITSKANKKPPSTKTLQEAPAPPWHILFKRTPTTQTTSCSGTVIKTFEGKFAMVLTAEHCNSLRKGKKMFLKGSKEDDPLTPVEIIASETIMNKDDNSVDYEKDIRLSMISVNPGELPKHIVAFPIERVFDQKPKEKETCKISGSGTLPREKEKEDFVFTEKGTGAGNFQVTKVTNSTVTLRQYTTNETLIAVIRGDSGGGVFCSNSTEFSWENAHLVGVTSTAGIYKDPPYIVSTTTATSITPRILFDTIRQVEEDAQTTIRKNSDLNLMIIKASNMLFMIIFGTTIYYCNKKPNPTPKELENDAPPVTDRDRDIETGNPKE